MASNLRGRYAHTIDVKGRMNFPTKLREKLGECFIITKGLDGCLFVYSMEEWEQLEEKLNAQKMASREGRMAQRHFCSNAQELESDKQGRVLIPAFLREYAAIDKDVIVIGAGARAEVWDKARLEALESEELTDDKIEDMMQNLDF